VESLAGQVDSSVQDLLDVNPDLHQRLRRLADRLNIPGTNATEPEMSISPQSGPPASFVTVSATGLRKNASVAIGGGTPHSAYQVLDQARSTDSGTLQATVQVPDWADTADRFVLVIVDSDGKTRVRSSAFRIVK
jgi:hypothetical protein